MKNLKTGQKLIKDYDEYYLSFKDLWTLFIKTYGFSLLIIISFYKSMILSLIMIPVCLIIPFFMKPMLIRDRKEKLLSEFKDFLRVLKSNLEASYSIENSFLLSLNEIKMQYGEKSLMYEEILNICKLMKVNVPIEKAFLSFSKRAKIEDIKDFSDALILVKTLGGNISKVINNVINILNDKIEVERDIKMATASKKFEQNIMSLLPFLIIIYINFSSKGLLDPLYNTIFGRLFMTFLLGVYFLSVYIAKKILDIKL